ncbi:MAG: agmatine deiminase family protein [Lewinellaceae bacterium]|nr:agmatine deiminase family protein [Phaeodactylibacter sp.]MCB9348652.1 agmatine deiminase family protein [Lewinellaceae bacterium]
MTKYVLTLLVCFYSWTALAQQDAIPHYPTRAEAREMEAFIDSLQSRDPGLIAEPPPAPVRTMAEWEEIQAIAISWTQQYAGILTEIVRHSAPECTVIVITTNPNSVTQQLQNAGIPLENVEVVNAPYNSVWIRDYGPWAVYHNDVDSLMIVDWIYNRPWRTQDDQIPTVLAGHLNLPIYEATVAPYDWIHTGGNNLRDGMGTNFSSELVLEENPGKTEADIDAIAQAFLGANRYIKFPTLPYDLIHHIDMHMRFIDEETVIIGAYPEGVADGPQIEENVEYLINEVPTAFGNTYQAIRMPMPPDAAGRYPDNNGDYRTYTNSIFVNKTLLVPTYEERYDTTALRIYREALPGYNVVGIDCNDIIPAFGALHCITKLIGVNDPLWIAHSRLRDTDDTENDYLARAIIKHRSGIAHATLHYRIVPELDYTAVPMTLEDSAAAIWLAAIPAQAADAEVQYYIHATAHSGKEQVRPLVAPEGYFPFRVDALAPAFTVSFPEACPGNLVQFLDQSSGNINSWQWAFPGGQPATSTEQNPSVSYPQEGSYGATLIVGNGLSFDTLTIEEAIVVTRGITPYFEAFNEPLSANNWTVDNPDADAAAWATSEDGLCYRSALVMDNYTADTRYTSDFFRAQFSLAGLTNPKLHFALAYAPYNETFFDGLKVRAITCDGDTIPLYQAFGAELATAPATTEVFIPSDCNLWRQIILPLDSFTGESIVIEFENVGGNGNRLYIDNIDISASELANQPPTIAITSPGEGSLFTGSLPELELRVAAADTDGIVQRVDFFINSDSIDTAPFPPFGLNYPLTAYGTYSLQARAVDNDGASALSSPVQITVEPTTGVTTLPGSSGLQFESFPNPASGQLNLRFTNSQPAEVSVQLFNSLGQCVYSAPTSLPAGTAFWQLPVTQLPAGVYQLSVAHAGASASSKVVVD